MEKLFIVQPFVPAYRVKPFSELCEKWDVTLIASRSNGSDGFGDSLDNFRDIAEIVQSKTFSFFGGRIFWQSLVVKNIILNKPKSIFIFANVRFVSFWVTLFLCKFLGVNVYSHGQGLYRKKTVSILGKLSYKIILNLSTKYLCYAPIVAKSFASLDLNNKCYVVDNSIDRIVGEKKSRFGCVDILFIGRLRDRSEFPMLVDAVGVVRNKFGINIKLNVVGQGLMENEWRKMFECFPWIVWHGLEYDFKKIEVIAEKCLVGCYPGDAGLSIVDFMALGLVVLAHDDDSMHMGPEPSYIENGSNGFRFIRGNVASLSDVLCKIYADMDSALLVANRALEFYKDLNNPTLGERIDLAMRD